MRGLMKQAQQRKAFNDGSLGQDVGWTRLGSGAGAALSPRRVSAMLGTYGGTEDAVGWVYACTSLIASELASYQYALQLRDGTPIENPPTDLVTVLDSPNPRMTYFDWVEAVGTDLELAGNSYWLADELNALSQPAQLMRLRPEHVEIAVNAVGQITGYVHTIRGRQVPYDVEEVIHYRYPNPLSDVYGMGTVEALIRAISTELAQSEHVRGFFSNGARISGVLITSGTLSDQQFLRLKDQFAEEYSGSANAFKTLIAEEGMDFKPMSAEPAKLGVVELMKLSKDEILSGFGVPANLLGGVMENANYKMEESQHIFSRTMRPKARRFSERTTIDLVRRWSADAGMDGITFKLEQTTAEPPSVRVSRAKLMIGASATWNESRDEMGLPPSDDPTADLIVSPNGDPTAIVVARKTAKAAPPALAPGDPLVVSALEVPVYPTWAKQFGDIKSGVVADDVLTTLMRHHAQVLRDGVDLLRPAFVQLFVGQRTRVIDALAQFRQPGDRANSGKLDRKELTPSALWNDDAEHHALMDMYLPLVDELGQEALSIPARLVGSSLVWDLQAPTIGAARKRLGDLIVRINATTQQAVAHQVEEGMRRGYSIPQIANGVPKEGFRGIMGAFDEATTARAEVIARSETAMIYNAAATAGYRDGGVEKVLVIDGNGDGPCALANGSTWPLDQAEEDPIAHPNCVRVFAPVVS